MIEANRVLPKIATALFIGLLLFWLIRLETKYDNIKENITTEDVAEDLYNNKIESSLTNRERRVKRSVILKNRHLSPTLNSKLYKTDLTKDSNNTRSTSMEVFSESSTSSGCKCELNLLRKDVLFLIVVCCAISMLAGCIVCVILPWKLWQIFKKRKQFSPNKWWMSGDDDIYDMVSLMRHRKKFLQKQQLSFENNLFTPLLSVNTQYLRQ
ncbi:uncharacterized protein LOC111638673 [Centruroides sculpturatus]|uniref:uncharacterized protein LOC111638673 n=1 Tax=Centruroides sculpturatus TaxID=218467 RepID=UPI000C6E2CD2|nr:uncharacterized protein LOC111638673 [Centruroides sculpturatus]